MNTDQIRVVTDFVLQIREQGNQLFETLLTISMGTLLAGVLGAAIATKGETKANCSSKWLCFIVLSASLFFLAYIGFLRVKHTARRDFCDKWIANHLQSTPKDAAILISEFSASYYGFVNPGEAKYVVDPNDKPNTCFNKWTEGRAGLVTTYILPCLAGVLVVIGLFIPRRSYLETLTK